MTSLAARRVTPRFVVAAPVRRVARALSTARASLAGSYEAYGAAARKPSTVMLMVPRG